MKTVEFLQVAPKLATTGLIRVAKSGEKNPGLGYAAIGSTDRQNTKLWRLYGTLENILIFRKAEEVNETLKANGINEFVAKKTKSGNSCRLILSA